MDVVKIVASSGVAFALDRFWLKNTDMTHNATFALSSAIGIGAGAVVGSFLPDMPMKFANGKAVMTRVAEIGMGAGSSWYVNKYVMGNSSWSDNAKQQIVSIVVSDVLGEYVADYIQGRPLSILS